MKKIIFLLIVVIAMTVTLPAFAVYADDDDNNSGEIVAADDTPAHVAQEDSRQTGPLPNQQTESSVSAEPDTQSQQTNQDGSEDAYEDIDSGNEEEERVYTQAEMDMKTKSLSDEIDGLNDENERLLDECAEKDETISQMFTADEVEEIKAQYADIGYHDATMFWVLCLGIPLFVAIAAFIGFVFLHRSVLNKNRKRTANLNEQVQNLKNEKNIMIKEKGALEAKYVKTQQEINLLNKNAESAAKLSGSSRTEPNEPLSFKQSPENISETKYKRLLNEVNKNLCPITDRIRWKTAIEKNYPNYNYISLYANGNYSVGKQITGGSNYLVAAIPGDNGVYYVVPFAEDMKQCEIFYDMDTQMEMPIIERFAEITLSISPFKVQTKGRLGSVEA